MANGTQLHEVPAGSRPDTDAALARRQLFVDWVDALLADDASVLAVPCGTGDAARVWAARPRRSVVGVDSATGAAGASATGGATGGRARFEAASPHSLPFPDGTFSAVVVAELWRTSGSFAEFLDEVLRVVRHDGLVVVRVDHGDSAGHAGDAIAQLDAALRQRFQRVVTVSEHLGTAYWIGSVGDVPTVTSVARPFSPLSPDTADRCVFVATNAALPHALPAALSVTPDPDADASFELWRQQDEIVQAQRDVISQLERRHDLAVTLRAQLLSAEQQLADLPQLHDRLIRLADEVARLRAEAGEWEARARDREAALAALLDSTSWKLTQPMRRLKDHLRPPPPADPPDAPRDGRASRR